MSIFTNRPNNKRDRAIGQYGRFCVDPPECDALFALTSHFRFGEMKPARRAANRLTGAPRAAAEFAIAD
jgi:hypothetical protein